MKITSTLEYMWRVNVVDHWFNHVKCFHVVDDNGTLIEGGYKSGNNHTSGQPRFSRKMDAAAWIAGYNDCLNGKDGVTYVVRGETTISFGSGKTYAQSIGKRFDDIVAQSYESGAYTALHVKSVKAA